MNATCPICKQEFASDSRQGPFPFCSWRCKKVDLYHWLNEEYCISEPLRGDAFTEVEAVDDQPGRGAPS